MKYLILMNLVLLLISCNNVQNTNKVFTNEELLSRINIDSLSFDPKENSYYDKFGDSSGSIYKFNNKGQLTFYCFLNTQSYPYAEYYDENGDILKSEGKTSVQTRIRKNDDSSYTISFLYSTFRKSNYSVVSTTNFGDTLKNDLSKANIYSNIGFFNVAVKNIVYAKKIEIINYVNYYDSLKKSYFNYLDTIVVAKLL